MHLPQCVYQKCVLLRPQCLPQSKRRHKTPVDFSIFASDRQALKRQTNLQTHPKTCPRQCYTQRPPGTKLSDAQLCPTPLGSGALQGLPTPAPHGLMLHCSIWARGPAASSQHHLRDAPPCTQVPLPRHQQQGRRREILPLLSVASFLSDKLMASDAPSGICRGRGEQTFNGDSTLAAPPSQPGMDPGSSQSLGMLVQRLLCHKHTPATALPLLPCMGTGNNGTALLGKAFLRANTRLGHSQMMGIRQIYVSKINFWHVDTR